MTIKYIITGIFILSCASLKAQNTTHNPGSNHGNKFEQLGTILPTPNEQRTASGAPGVKYWQQRADYTIKCKLDENALTLKGSEEIVYTNNSPDPLTYIWIQLDENEHSTYKNANYQIASKMPAIGSTQKLATLQNKADNGFGIDITNITNGGDKPLKYIINKTMMRIDLPCALKSGQKYVFKIDWNYKISDRMVQNGRGGYEFFPADGNYIFTMSQWYPRLCVYSDFQGWQNHQFTGNGEFALTFGDFKVQMTVPSDHLVAGTGQCLNYNTVLTPTQLARYNKVKSATKPIEIQNLAEAKAAELNKSKNTKTWVFNAQNVRDFAWTTSRKFIWDAMPQKIADNNNIVMCMSFYGKEAYNLWSKYSTRVIAHTVKTYSDFTIPYPYPVAQSVEAANAMEYPMICFNYGRTNADGTYSEAVKNGLIGVVIHEVGHNFFPMIVNSDERQWTWMDEGLNSFLEYLTEELWDNKFPSKRGPAYTIIDYMKLPKNELEPIMTNSENIIHFGSSAYSKPTAGLNILRETIMGRELFDYAFKEYARRWAFKHPEPADFFRTMEDASGEDLDWFWRGWFYSTDPCDIALDSVKYATADFPVSVPAVRSKMVKIDKPLVREFQDISKIRNRETYKNDFYVEKDTATHDFYYKYDRGLIQLDATKILQIPGSINYEPVLTSDQNNYRYKYFYELNFSNKGGLIMPIIVEFTYKDGTKEIDRIPAQIWRKNELNTSKFYMKDKQVASILIDPLRETADIDTGNNTWGGAETASKFKIYKLKAATTARGQSVGRNPMQEEIKK
jgi:hypothetical protein